MNKLNENLAQARAILTRNGITQENTQEWADYQEIRKICATATGYVGLLTRLRFEEGVTDMLELAAILDVLQQNKMDLGKVSRLSYDQILDLFYDELKPDTEKELGYTKLLQDDYFTYYKVSTYKGILNIGSPAWCLKTKSDWNRYQESHPRQFVVVMNKYAKKLFVPADFPSSPDFKYVSPIPHSRFGISLNSNDEFITFDDDNKSGKCPTMIIQTIIWCESYGWKKPFYQSFESDDIAPFRKLLGWFPKFGYLTKTWRLRVEDFQSRLRVFNDSTLNQHIFLRAEWKREDADRVHGRMLFLLCCDREICALSDAPGGGDYATTDLSSRSISKALEGSTSPIYLAFKLHLKQITHDQIRQRPDYWGEIGKWFIFDEGNNLLIINTIPADGFHFPIMRWRPGSSPPRNHSSTIYHSTEDPGYFRVVKSTLALTSYFGSPITLDFGETYKFIKSFLIEKGLKDKTPRSELPKVEAPPTPPKRRPRIVK